MANPVCEKVLDKLKKRLSYGLDPDNLSVSKSASLSVKAAYLVYCAEKHGVLLPESDLIDCACRILNLSPNTNTYNYASKYIQWMRENIGGLNTDERIQKKYRNILNQMEKRYAWQMKKVVETKIALEQADVLDEIKKEKERIQHRRGHIKQKTIRAMSVKTENQTPDEYLTVLETMLLNDKDISVLSDSPHWEAYTLTMIAAYLKQQYIYLDEKEILSNVFLMIKGYPPTETKVISLFVFYNTLVKHIRFRMPPMPEVDEQKFETLNFTLKSVNQDIKDIVDSGNLRLFANKKKLMRKVGVDIRRQIEIALSKPQKKRQPQTNEERLAKKRGYNRKYYAERQRMTMEEYRQYQREQHIITLERKREEAKRENDRRAKFKQSNPEIVVHKVRLEVNNKIREYLIKCFGVARFCYNWALEEWLSARERGERIFTNELMVRFNDIAMSKYPFTYEVNSWAKKTGFERFEYALDHFIMTGAMPQHKRRKLGLGSYHYLIGRDRKLHPILMDYNPDVPGSKSSKKRQYLYIPTVGYAKMMERLRFDGMLTSVTIKLESDGHFYACLQVYINQDEWKSKHLIADKPIKDPIGIDLGVKDFAILSNGMKLNDSRKDKQLYQRKRYLQKAINRCELKSKRRKELKWKLAHTRAKIGDRYTDFLHKVTSVIAYNCSHVAMEHLNIHTMIQEGRASGRIQQAAFYKTRVLMEQKMVLAGHTLHIADKFFPSTRTCSVCGCIGPEVPLDQRTFHCADCGAEMDRDLNAAINLARLLGLGKPYKPADSLRLSAVLQKNGISVSETEAGKQVEPWI